MLPLWSNLKESARFIVIYLFIAAEYCGEKLADFFGITAPKYQYAINEYHRLQQEVRMNLCSCGVPDGLVFFL